MSVLFVQMAKRKHSYAPAARDAAQLLAAQIRDARASRRWAVRELSERAGISTDTLRKVERGDPTVALGTAFDVASLLGVPLFYEDRARLADEAARVRREPTLIRRVVRPRGTELENDF